MRTLVAIRIGLVAKVFRVLEALMLLYYLVALAKIEYLVVTPGVITPLEPLLVIGLLTLRLKIKV